jgi:hypothetical protein
MWSWPVESWYCRASSPEGDIQWALRLPWHIRMVLPNGATALALEIRKFIIESGTLNIGSADDFRSASPVSDAGLAVRFQCCPSFEKI